MTADSLILCAVYKTSKTEETYLFVDRAEGMERVPEDLKALFPDPKLVTQFKLTADRKLARADARKVITGIREQGYYLQLPPPKDAHLTALADKNEKLPRR